MSWNCAMLDLSDHDPHADTPVFPVVSPSDLPVQSTFPAARSITPRRPLRLSPLRDDAPLDPRQPLAALNIFADVFDAEPSAETAPCIDPRVAASRRRARQLAGRQLNTLAPEEANFWHPSVPEALPEPQPIHDTATIAANDIPDLPAPLHEQLARVREALYAAHLDEDAEKIEASSLQLRLASHAMTATLVVVAFPVGAALTTYSLLRGANVRLSAQAMALVASVLGIIQGGFPHLL